LLTGCSDALDSMFLHMLTPDGQNSMFKVIMACISHVDDLHLCRHHIFLTHGSWVVPTQYWAEHTTTYGRLPAAVAVLEASACPCGLSDSDFVQILTQLSNMPEWRAWGLHGVVDSLGCGLVSLSARGCSSQVADTSSSRRRGHDVSARHMGGHCQTAQ